MKEALGSYVDAIALEPEHFEAHFNASITRLCLGDYREGWKQYEYRWKRKEFARDRRDLPERMWRGEKDLDGKAVLLFSEQGFGDTIQFMRYAPLVAALGARVILVVQRPLIPLAVTVPGVSLVSGDTEPLPDFDFYCPLLSVPLGFQTEIATIPASIPYIRAQQDRTAKWYGKLPGGHRLRVGICWAGNSIHLNDRNRSIALERFAKILTVPGLDFISLQKDVSEVQAAILNDHGVVQFGQEFEDFSDTAAVVAMLDLVVAVDTSIAHLAGAMGKAVALLVPFSPDWRWLLDRTDSPWYPTMRLFRQAAVGEWDGPIERLRQELTALAHRSIRPR